MFANLDDSVNLEPLYNKVQKVFIKNFKNEDTYKDLRILIDLTTSLSKFSKQVLNIQLTDDEDPYFIFSLVITEEDYQQLKAVQGLLVDFYNFPNEMVKLLEGCCSGDHKGTKFLLMLENESLNDISKSTKTFLKVVEANNFKHLCHLQLQVLPGDDSDIKKLMLGKIKALKDNSWKNEKVIDQLNSKVSSLTSQLESKSEELIRIHQKWNDDKLAYKVESTKEINEETEKFRKMQIEWQVKMQRERNDIEEKFLSSIKDKENELAELRLANQVYIERKTVLEGTIKDQAKQIDNLEKELSTVRWDLSSLRKQSSKLDSDYHEKEKSVNGLRTKLAVAEQELKDKSIMLNKLQELLSSNQEQKTRMEEMLTEKDKIIHKKQASIQNISEEIMKANEIIAKLQKELAVSDSKLKVRTSIALEQEKVVEGSKKRIQDLESELSTKNVRLKEANETEESLKKLVEEMKELISSKDKTIKDNERIIDWLNRRINDDESPHWTKNIPGSTPYSVLRSDDHNTPVNNPPTSIIEKPRQSEEVEKVPNLIDRLTAATVSEVSSGKIQGNPQKPTPPSSKVSKKFTKPPGVKRVTLMNRSSPVPSSYFSK